MTSENKTLSLAEKIKAFAMGGIGAGIFAMGSTYFSAKSSYRVPRILLPVYNQFGNTGLAIGMLILGVLLMYYAFYSFKKNSGNISTFLIYLVVAIVAFYGIIYATNKKPSDAEVQEHFENNEKALKEKLDNTDRPGTDNASINTYFDKLEALNAKFKTAENDTDKTLQNKYEEEYVQLLTDFSTVAPEMQKQKNYADFAMYNAKLMSVINDIRMKWAGN